MIQRIDDITSVTRRSGAEIHEGLNVVETWDSANGYIFFIFFGRGARWQATARRTRRSRCTPCACCSPARST